MVHVLEAL
jgi:hypothetical protein